MAEPDHKEGHEERPLDRTSLTGSVSKGSPPSDEEIPDAVGLKVRLAVRGNHLQELAPKLAKARSQAGEFRAVRENLEVRIRTLSEERDLLGERVRELEDEVRRQSRGREALEREFGERAAESEELRATLHELRQELEDEYELRRSLAEPGDRLRAGIKLFNESEHLGAVGPLSRSMGQPEVNATLGAGEEPAAILGLTWQGITWQTYAADPGLAVEEPRVYSKSSGEDLSGVDREPPNVHIGPGGRLYLEV